MKVRARVWLLQAIPLVRTVTTGNARPASRPIFSAIVRPLWEQPAV